MDLTVTGSDELGRGVRGEFCPRGLVLVTDEHAPAGRNVLDEHQASSSEGTRGRRCACRKLRPCRLNGVAILVDDSAETVLPIYAEALDLIGFERLGPDP